MAKDGVQSFLKTPTAVVFEIALGVVLLVAAASVADWITSEQAAITFLCIGGAALLISAIVSSGRRHGLWRWVVETAEQAMNTATDGKAEESGLYRFALLALGFTVAAIPIGVMATMALWDLAFSDVWPVLLAGCALLLLMLALMAISYAPPGPNWIHRIAGIDGRALLVMIGIAVVVLGTLQFFEYGSDGSPPSDWWLGVVAIGLLIGLIGLSGNRRGVRPVADGQGESTADKVRTAARRARRHSTEAEEARRRAELAATDEDNAQYREAARAAAAADSAAEKAERAADRAAESETEITSLLAETARDARAAEVAARAARNAANQLKQAAEAAKEIE